MPLGEFRHTGTASSYADYVNVLGRWIRAIKKKSEALVVASKETGLEVSAEKAKYMAMSRDQNAGQSHIIKIDNSTFERVDQFKCLGATLTYHNSIQEEIKSRLKSGNACYFLAQNLLFSSLLSKNVKMRIYRTIILPIVLYGCETWLLTLRAVCRLRVSENRVLRRIFGPRRVEVTGEWRKTT